MTNLILHLFIKDWRNSGDPAVRGAIGSMAGIVGILCNALLAAGKLTVGLLAGSVSVLADAVNNLSDAASSVVTLLGFRLSQRPADEEHPFGHARYEYLSALAVAGLILLLGYDTARSAVEKIIHPEPVELTAVSMAVLAASVGLKLWMYGFFSKLAKHIGSAALRAAAADSRNDCVATTAVLLGCLSQKYLGVNADGFVGLGVALFILWSGISLAKETVSPLLGRQADPELVRQITELVLSREQVLGAHDLLVHDYGPGRYFASVHAEMDAAVDSVTAHDIIDGIEQQALEQLNIHLVIHCDPRTDQT